MRTIRRPLLAVAAIAALAAGALSTATAGAGTSSSAASAGTAEYLVLVKDGASRAAARAAVEKAGGTVLKQNTKIGTLTVKASADGFVAAVSGKGAIAGAARNRPIGQIPTGIAPRADVEKVGAAGKAAKTAKAAKKSKASAAVGMDPLDSQLWGLRMVRSDLARTVQPGKKAVKVGVLDSGVDMRNPDIAPNFDKALSRNFAPDLPEIDGPCEFRGCVDPVGWDDSGHGTHVAGTIGAAANDFGVSGVAPKVTLVEVRGGQDSGFVFPGPVTEALTYAADVHLDVVNMSFYVDPWLYNCTNNPADSPTAQAEQRTIIQAMTRALNYAHRGGVTLVGSLGNNHEDLGKPRTDISSPDFPDGTAYPRPIDNSTCLSLPVEGPHVIGVSALGPSAAKADYSNYGVEQTDVSAPGGYFRDYFGTPFFRTNENQILSTYPVNTLQNHTDAAGNPQPYVDPAGTITPDGLAAGVQKSCPAGVTDYTQCGYYAFLQGTSMASPHATGVAALIVSQFGKKTGGEFGYSPDKVEKILKNTAADRACPNPPLVTYTNEGRPAEFNALCEGTRAYNGFYGHGIVDAYAAVRSNG